MEINFFIITLALISTLIHSTLSFIDFKSEMANLE